MSIGAVSGSHAGLAAQAMQRMPEAAEVQKSGPDNDGDGDDAVQAAAAPAPTVNLNGQKLGQHINVTA